MTRPLIEVIDRLDEVDDNNEDFFQVIYAKGGKNAFESSPAQICLEGETEAEICPYNSQLSKFLYVFLAREAIETWSFWRGGLVPTPEEKLAAAMHMARHSFHLPSGMSLEAKESLKAELSLLDLEIAMVDVINVYVREVLDPLGMLDSELELSAGSHALKRRDEIVESVALPLVRRKAGSI